MVDVLPGYTWDSRTSRYRANATGRYVARRDILTLVEGRVNGAEGRMAELTTALMEGRLAPAVWEAQARAELKRQHLANRSLGAGGWERLSQREYGIIGRRLRDDYARAAQLAADIESGKATLPQALVRVNNYVGNARVEFWEAEQERVQRSTSNMIVIWRRLLGSAAKHCRSCVEFYNQGWQLSMPPPGVDSECGGACRCRLEYREVPAAEVNEWLGTKK